MREIALQKAPHARLEGLVAIRPVALPQAAENAQDARVSLGRQGPIGALEPLVRAGPFDIAVDHGSLDVGRNITPGILQHRDQIIGRMPRQRILEVEQSEPLYSAASV